MLRTQLRGLYAILSPSIASNATLLEQATACLNGGAKIIQLRDKSSSRELRYKRAEELLRLCRIKKIPLIINDDYLMAHEIGASGVHLGLSDCDRHQIPQVRALLGSEAIIGLTCHGSLELAKEAKMLTADYIALGACYPSITKPNAEVISLNQFKKIREEIQLPVVAIGGITPENGKVLVEAGADMIAAIHGLLARGNLTDNAKAYSQLYE